MIRYMVHNTVHTIIRRRGRLFSALSLLLLMLTSGAGSAFAQETQDYSGVYYIASNYINNKVNQYDPVNLTNNYYLCPTEGWAFYVSGGTVTGTDNGQPFITTHKRASGDEAKYKWIVEKHVIDGVDYYTFRYGIDYVDGESTISRYMSYSRKLNGAGTDRMRVHLEKTTTPGDNEFFRIIVQGSYLVISPKNTDADESNKTKYLTVNGGNKNNYIGNSGKTGGPSGYTNTAGVIGTYWDITDVNAPFFLEDYYTRPTIGFNSSQRIEITDQTGSATAIYYTTDGSTPTTSSTLYTGAFDPADNVTTINAIAVIDGVQTNVATFTTPVLCGTNHKRLIQSQNKGDNDDYHFYMIPGDVDANNNSITRVNTTSLFRPTMEWHFLNGGVENGVQYFYIVNYNGDYLSYDATNGVRMAAYDSNNANNFKFSIVESSTTAGKYNIIAHEATNSTKYLTKKNGNAAADNIILTNGPTAENALWSFVKQDALDRDVPFTVSDANSITYYKLRSSGDEYYIKAPASANANATMVAAADADVNTDWYFEQAAQATNSDWLAYYYIRNALTGDYLYYANGNPSNSNAAFKTSASIGEETERYQFTWARSATQDYYFIIPKMLRDQVFGNISTMFRDNTTRLRINKTRVTANASWTFVPANYCNDPSISQAANGDITITCPTPGTEIYYTLNGSDPVIPATGQEPTSPTYKYSVTFTPAIGSTGVKAVAAITSDHTVQSSIVEHQFVPCTAPNISFNGISIITITAGSGASIYYTEDGTEPSTQSNLYNGSFTINNAATIKAIAVHTGFLTSQVAQLSIEQVATPTSTYNQENGSITLSCATEGATLYYTLDGSTPTRSSTLYSSPLTAGISGKTIKVLAVKDNMLNSGVYTSNPVTIQCAPPTFRRIDATTVQLVCSIPTDGVIFYYTTGTTADDTGEPTSSSNPGSTITFDPDDLPIYIKAIATAQGYINSTVAGRSIGADLNQDETEAYLISSSDDYDLFCSKVQENPQTRFKIIADIALSGNTTINTDFSGSLEAAIDPATNMPYIISGLNNPIFSTIDGGTVKNLMLSDVSISGHSGNTGAIACNATGATRIYNVGILDGQVGGSGHTGGLVGYIDGNARVINCFSYANITSGSNRAGIVGYNNNPATAATVATGTMVMNCMFYGDITQGGNISPVYGGNNISNVTGGLNTFNYYLYESTYSSGGYITAGKYNSAISVKQVNLTRFEYYRELLNSNKKLAAIYATGSADNADQKMLKWALETADRKNSSPKPYPVLKQQGKYPSIINYDTRDLTDYSDANRNQGLKTGTLAVTISQGSNAPTGATITKGSLTLTRTDKDYAHFNFNYDKVQLPYYNEVGTGNYTGNKVVTGWIITDITTIDGDEYTAANFDYSKKYTTDAAYLDAINNFNFADRNSSKKDLYSVSGRVFSQGAYFDVPYGVTSITIQPYWGKAAYIADGRYDVVYSSGYTADAVEELGTQITNNTNQSINGSNQKVYTDIATALGTLDGSSVYDNALVLVGNLHLHAEPSQGGTPFTMMSIDLDKDNEPDYSLIYHHDNRKKVSPIRFDFINVLGTAMAQKPNDAVKLYNVGIFNPSGWFEVTNTCLIHLVQFEYDNGDKAAAPLILQGGVYEQFTSSHKVNDKGPLSATTQFILVGGNAYFKNFSNGCHGEVWQYTPHIPISVTGGDYEGFYLSGIYQPDAEIIDDNAECYISGGRFGEMAGAAQQHIIGNVYWQIYNADINEFYGGGLNAAKPITGNITTNIYNSHVTTFCGGPKFGDMQKVGDITIQYRTAKDATTTTTRTIDADRTVTTIAQGCTFTNYFGAGYGGTSFNKITTQDGKATTAFGDWVTAYTTNRANYISANNGIATDFEYDAFVWSTGEPAGRFRVNYASFSLAQTNDVSSTLTDCIITGNFYGGGNRGKVNGKATSILEDCSITGNVFGAGFSAAEATVDIRDGGFNGKTPQINLETGLFEEGILTGTTTYTWTQGSVSDGNTAIATVGGKNVIYTTEDLTTLGQVTEVDLTIKGSTTIGGSVFGGGAESATHGAIDVKIENAGITENVFGGGDKGAVTGDPKVYIANANTDATKDLSVGGSVYGGGNEATTTGNPHVTMTGGTVTGNVYGGGLGSTATVTGNDTVIISAGTVNNDVYGGGSQGAVTGNVSVTISGSAAVDGDVYGGGALASTNTDGTSATSVSLTGGTVRDVYGGGLGRKASQDVTAVEADVNGPVTVTIDGGDARYVFGCNNLNGSPKSSVQVIINSTDATITQNSVKTYALQAVYGGGNLAHYNPTTPSTYPTVTVNGCETSIKDVFGGGNAAAVPYTHVTINGGDIDRVFVGGNGENGAAHVGYLNSDNTPTSGSYGLGTANATITGGTINKVFGGGNSLGTVRATGTLSINKSTAAGACDMLIGEVYGGGNQANGAASTITIGSTGTIVTGTNGHAAHPENIGTSLEGIGTVYGGANEADVTGNIALTINGGMIATVYGGNNNSGSISGTVSVNIEKTTAGSNWYIGDVFGGGNLASYTGSPIVNIKNGTVSGNVYGGGNGNPEDPTQTAGSTAAPTVIIGDLTPANSAYVAIVSGDVYGGGNAAKVTGNDAPSVTVQKCNTEVGYVYGGGNAADVPATDVTISGGSITEVYGGGHGDNTQGSEKAADVTGNVSVSVTGGTISQLFAGSNLNGNIGGTVSLEIDADGTCEMKIGEVYGGGNQAAGNAGTITIVCTGTWTTDNDDTDDNNNFHNKHNNTDNRIGYELEGIGTVYGGANRADIGTQNDNSNIILNINSGIVDNVFGGNNTSGTIHGTIQVNIEKDNSSCSWYVGNVYGGGNLAPYIGSPTVNIKNGTVSGSVYGGGKGETADVTGSPVVTVGDLTPENSAYVATVTGDVYGGGDAASVTGNTSVTLQKASSGAGRLFGGGNQAGISGNTVISMTAGTVTNAVYGGCNTSGTVGGTSTVTVTDGRIGTAFAQLPASIPLVVFGGGKGAGTSVTGQVTLNIGTKNGNNYTGSANIYGNVYGGSENGEVHAVDVNLYGNTIYGNVFGGGYRTDPDNTGTIIAATNVNVILDGTVFDRTYDGTAQIFGANDMKGSPTGHVQVHVKRTEAAANQSGNTYYLYAVYGGGNEADYEPSSTDETQSTEVLIEGCGTTKIEYVYGGGNAAAVPASEVWIFGSDIIGNVFGGGNGERGAEYAAHVGFHRTSATTHNPYENGSGKTFVNLVGGTITNVYGGSNSHGDIRGGTNIKMPQNYYGSADIVEIGNDGCSLNATNIYGGGKNAPMSSGASIELGCMPNTWIDEIYAGAQAADVGGDVSLTITSGNFGRVFGGNKDSGRLMGSITVNIEETGDCTVPIIIGELYGGGNQADYSIYGYKNNGTEESPNWVPKLKAEYDAWFETLSPFDKENPENWPYNNPQLNVRAFTSIGAIYGGGLEAKVYGSPTIDINVVKGSHAADAIIAGSTGGTATLPYPAHAANEIGAIGNIYGGGNLANVIGNTSINIGTATTIDMETEPTHLSGYTYNQETKLYEGVSVSGAKITGNIYGGGNDADIEGNTLINIGTVDLTGVGLSGTTVAGDIFGGGKGSGTTVTGDVEINIGTNESGTPVGYATISGNVYGGSAFGAVNATKGANYDSNNNDIAATTDKTTQVNIYGGSVTGSVFGGGEGQTSPSSIVARSFGDATVNIEGGTVGTAVYGGSNVNGVMKAKATVTVSGGTIGSDPGLGDIQNVVFGGGKGQPTVVDGDVEVNIGTFANSTPAGTAVIWGNVYGGSALGNVNGTSATSNTHTTAVNLYQGTVNGDIYGGGLGQTSPSSIAANVYGLVTVTTKGGTATNVFGSNNLNGAPQQTVTVNIDGGTFSGNVYGGGNLAAYGTALAPGTATVNMNGGQAANIFGGGYGATAIVTGNTAVTVSGGTVSNNVYGGGDAANLTGNAGVTVSGGTVSKAVYGGGNMANVSGNSTVNISGGTISGDNTSFGSVRGAVFGGGYGNTTLVGGSVQVNINGNSTITGDVYGGSAKGKVNTTDGTNATANATTSVSLTGGRINGDLYGGGLGDNTYAADVFGPVTVTTSGNVIDSELGLTSVSTVTNVFGGNNINGTPKSTITVNIGGGIITNSIYGGGNAAAYTGSPSVSMTAGRAGNLFGGGLGTSATVTGSPVVTISGGTITDNVYGGGSLAKVTGSTSVTLSNTGRVNKNLFGGGSEADVTGSVNVAISGGWVTNAVYGGGAFANTNTDNWDFNNSTWATGKNSAQNKTTDTTAVILTGGIVGDVYGGGLGQIKDGAVEYRPATYYTAQEAEAYNTANGFTSDDSGYKHEGDLKTEAIPAAPAIEAREAMVYGDITLTVNGTAFKQSNRLPEGDQDPVPTSGRVFGCNNKNGSPMGNVTVTVSSTVQLNDADERIPGHKDNKYDIHSVYGGGNLANYEPSPGKETKVIIDGCGETSIEKVFGGGNSASVPSTDVVIYGNYAMGYAFGGGNGADKILQRDGTWKENDGAPIYGDVTIKAVGGKIGQVFSGSDTKGTVYGNATLLLNGDDFTETTDCPLVITNSYGAARGADINGDVNFTITGCNQNDGIENVYAGSYDANIRGSVTLTINSGIFTNVFGGNDHGGTIGGNITVNVEELDPDHECKPIIIQHLYGGGREATYPGTGAKYVSNSYPDPEDNTKTIYEYTGFSSGKITVNIKSCTRIDNLYGGSLKAPVIGNTEVNVNMIKGAWAGRSVTIPKEYAYIPNIVFGQVNQDGKTITGTINDAIGTIGNIFGGADEGMVTGNSVVNIGTQTSYGNVPVLGANITGDVYGGGNNADIRGNTYVNICAENTNGVPTGNAVDLTGNAGYEGIKIKGSVYGGGNLGSVGTFDHINDAKPTTLAKNGTGISTVTILSDAEIGPDDMKMITASGWPDDKGHVFGASKGALKDPQQDNTVKYTAYVYNSNVTIGGTAFVKGSVYGGSENGHVLHDTHVIIKDNCQIGNGWDPTKNNGAGGGVNRRYTAQEWASESLYECASWTYDASNPKSYDVYDYVDPDAETKVPKAATDGHTFYGNVFGGGSGYFPYAKNPYFADVKAKDPSYSDGLWMRSAGIVEGNTLVEILGGHILTSVYGGNEQTDVNGSCTIRMSGGTVGVPRTTAQMIAHPVTCYVFGGGKGDQRINFNSMTNVGSTNVSITGSARIFGSVFGGGEDGHVLGNAVTTIGTQGGDNSNIIIGSTGLSTVDGNIFGGGRGFTGTALTAGVVQGNITLDIYGGYIMGSVFGGGRIAPTGTYLVHPELDIVEDADGNVTSLPGTTDINPNYGALIPGTGHGNITINIYDGTTIGSTDQAESLGISVGDVFAGGKGSTNDYRLGMAKNTTLNIHGGIIKHNVYGGGELGSLGMVTGRTEHRDYKIENGAEGAHYNYGLSWPVDIQYTPQTTEVNGVATINITGGRIGTSGSIGGDVFGGSKGKAASLYEEADWANVYKTNVTIDYSGAANKATDSDINVTTEDGEYKLRITGSKECIAGSVYGGSEDGHIIGDTYLTLTDGIVGHCLYGGGKGKGKYTGVLKDYFSANHAGNKPEGPVPSFTAGKVYGNAHVTMEGGHVIRNIFGGGNLGSMGIGNYAGGQDDYSLVGYGELPAYSGTPTRTSDGNGNYIVDGATEGNLWSDPLFRNSGKAIVKVEGGTVGYFTNSVTAANMNDITTKDDLPTGNVFGGCRGEAAPNYYISPRYIYFPEYFFGYVNETEVIIGKENAPSARPRIFGSVYGGGQDGHVRRDAAVTIYNGEIGVDYDVFDDLIGNTPVTSTQFRDRGNIYGAGSGAGMYSITRSDNGQTETGLNYSSGSVTGNTIVTINGNTTVYQSVYGGGSLASVGPPNTGQGFDEFNTTANYPADYGRTVLTHASRTSNIVAINGGNIGNAAGIAADYGGNVFGASRGNVMSFNIHSDELARIANTIWTDVSINGGHVTGSVFGGGEMGSVKQGVNVNVTGGIIDYDVYGGGALASTNTSRKEVGANTGIYDYPTTTINLTGGSMDRVYGGGLGRLSFTNNIPSHEGGNAIMAKSGNVNINLNPGVSTSSPGAIVNKIFGANNFNGTPEGHITIHVYATQNKYKTANISSSNKFSHPRQGDDESTKTYLGRLLTIASDGNGGYVAGVDATVLAAAKTIYDKANPTDAELTEAIENTRNELYNLYDVQVIYGGGDLAAYVPTDALLDYTQNKARVDAARTEVLIDGCHQTSINQVYGGGNAASTSGTRVVISGTYEIEEVFGGGNGHDPYILEDGGVEYTYINQGANVGYHDYTSFAADETIANQFNPVDDPRAATKEGRDQYFKYGSGIATTEIRGGTIHSVYGGSNQKGNIRSTALSVYEDSNDDCPISIDETYGGGKNAPMDGEIELSLDCVREMDMIFGGAKNADINNNITLSITNGKYNKVFGGNNTGGAVYGSITVNIEEKGCVPIEIGDLYGGGYLAPYSIYGYEKDNNGNYKYYEVDANNQFIPEGNGYRLGNKNNGKLMPLEAGQTGAAANPASDPRINIISATRIDTIYGGGYKAKVVGTPYININMQEGMQDVYLKQGEYKDVDNHTHDAESVTTITQTENGETTTRHFITLERGTIGTIFGGGYMADIVGDTHIDIATGTWVSDWNNDRTPVYTATKNTYDENVDRNAAEITGNVFGGGDNADVTGNTYINIAGGHIYFSVYGGGRMGSIGTITSSTIHDDVETEFALSWPYEMTYKQGTGTTNINITGGRIGFTGKDNFKPDTKYGYLKWYRKKLEENEELEQNEVRLDNGDVFGGGKGQAGDRYAMAFVANVNTTNVNINYPATPSDSRVATSYNAAGTNEDCIAGSVYGGAEDGHVYGNTNVTINNGMIGHAVYGGGKGKGKYNVDLRKRTTSSSAPPDSLNVPVYSITAGKVYGNATITMNNGYVVRNIFGGGNLGSVGKGNYAGGTDDYTYYAPNQVKPSSGIHVGYGECLQDNLWINTDFMTSGIVTITVLDGTIGTANDTKDDLPTGNIFGGCRGIAVPNVPYSLQPRYLYCPEFYLGYVNESVVTIGDNVNHTAPRIYGSVYGGGQDGHVRREAKVTVYDGVIGNAYTTANRLLVGTLTLDDDEHPTPADLALIADHSDINHLQWLHRGNVMGAGSGIGMYDSNKDDEGDTYSTAAGSVTHRTIVNIKGGTIYHNVYGGGSLASVGPPKMGQTVDIDAPASSANNGNGYTDISTRLTNGKSSISIVNIESKVGDDESFANGYGGNVFGSSRGANAAEQPDLESGKTYASGFYNEVNIKAGANILGSVYGGGEAGMVFNDAKVNIADFEGATINSATIGRDVYGGGDQADVQGNTYVNIGGGWIKKSVYGGGNMGSVGKLSGTPVVHNTAKTQGMGAGAIYDFGLSWPVELQYVQGTGNTSVTVTGGRIGITGKDYMGFDESLSAEQQKALREDNGDIYGGSKGQPADRYVEALYANVNNTNVTISYPSNLSYTYDNIAGYINISGDKVTIKENIEGIHGSVYGGGENGHVIGNTTVTLNNGLIGHNMYGGGKGKDKYVGELIDYSTRNTSQTTYSTEVASIIAGKVYGNTNTTMNGGYILRNIFGGGNLASVGKGNYSGGTDDYSLEGYGELPSKVNNAEGPLWANDDFINSGICTVTVNGGTIGYFNAAYSDLSAFTKDELPTGNVFGSCRGMAAPNYNDISPRYLYFPEFFYGYVNQTIVTIGNALGGPRIMGSVYGGGQDGHVRRDSKVVINNGSIGIDYSQIAARISESNQFTDRGNVYGAGSGVGQFEYTTRQLIDAEHPELGFETTGTETGYNYSSGSVTGTTTIEINDGTIYQSVYGGGALASVGPPNIGAAHGLGFDEFQTTAQYSRPDGFEQYNSHLSTSSNNITINGGAIGNAVGNAAGYGGNIYGASRGNVGGLNLGATAFLHATSIWTNVDVKNGHIFGNIFGGGQLGEVKRDTRVIIGGAEQTVSSPVQGRSQSPQNVIQPVQPNNVQPQSGGQVQPRNSAEGATNAASESLRNTSTNLRRTQ